MLGMEINGKRERFIRRRLILLEIDEGLARIILKILNLLL